MNSEIEKLVSKYQSILNEKKTELLPEVFTKDAMFIGQPFPTTEGIEAITSLYENFLGELDFNVQFDIKEIVLDEEVGYLRTHSHGTIGPKGQVVPATEGNREIFVVKKVAGFWKFHRYIFNEVV
jgi:ketosteroid isomerase-like protein